ncbi:hypothetical protein HPB48_016547 [Haemaphysalis longicornis]|uniref:Uncharacterized protein n=1 Tax=Haemaphysalis longicornis TaxID=44386 RepID=A0A9J6FF37_HAELO|nr:hypothetical protein HPB48_016547 [Haemaphysalis longicornis]
MDRGIIETTRKLYRKELATSKFANSFAHDGFFRTVVSDPDDVQPDDDRTCSDLYEAVRKIAGQEVAGEFETFALTDAETPVVAPAMDAGIIDTVVGGPGEDEEPRKASFSYPTPPLSALYLSQCAFLFSTSRYPPLPALASLSRFSGFRHGLADFTGSD